MESISDGEKREAGRGQGALGELGDAGRSQAGVHLLS